MKRLTALEPGTEDIVIAYYPFIIGKQENLVDYVLRRETVSRLHLRIDRKEDRYYVQDLNSTNGTMPAAICWKITKSWKYGMAWRSALRERDTDLNKNVWKV